MINDANMIGYIIGGIVLFFIAVGFIADKTGLIKKTFGKEVDSAKKKEEKIVAPVVPVVAPILEPSEDNTIEQENEQIDDIDFGNISIDNDIQTDVELSDSLVSLDSIGDIDTENNQISDVDFSSDNANDFMVNEEQENVVDLNNDAADNVDDFMLNDSLENEALFADLNDSTSDFMLNDEENTSSDLSEEEIIDNEIETNKEIVEDNEYAEENTEEAIENSNDSIVIDSDLDEIVLPDLEEIEDNEEDVWKF